MATCTLDDIENLGFGDDDFNIRPSRPVTVTPKIKLINRRNNHGVKEGKQESKNNQIKLDRKKLFAILNRSSNSNSEKKWLNMKFKQYGVNNKDLLTLKIRMD